MDKVHSRAIEKYKTKLKLTSEQREVLVGLLLGDAHLETRNGGSTYRLKIEQSVKHREYVQHLYKLFDEWVRTPPKAKKSSGSDAYRDNWAFQTLSHGAFRFYGHQFYRDGEKRVPKLIHRWLTPRGLSYWYMDDGSIKSKESKGVIFNTQGFRKSETEILAEVVGSKFGLETSIRRQREGFQIYVSGASYENFVDLVDDHIIDEMRYKIPPARRT